jgi:phage terminase large subunit GpA-like protein
MRAVPATMAVATRARPKGRTRPVAHIELDTRDRVLLAPRERLSIVDFAERHVRVTEGPLVGDGAEPAAWSADTFPLQRTITESIDDLRWARIIIMTAPQAFGKTQAAALPALLYALLHRRVSVAYVAANLNLAVTQWVRKIKPAMLADRALGQLLHVNTDLGGSKGRRDFTNGTSLHCAGADSAGALSGYTVPVVVCDDVQSYPTTLPGFGHPADLAWKRVGAYPAEEQTKVAIGTAGTEEDYLWRSMLTSAYYCPFVPCLGCDTFQLLEWDRLVFDADDPAVAREGTYLACALDGCEHRIVFDELPEMLSRHLWVSCPPGEDWIVKPPAGGVIIDPGSAAVYPETARNTNVAGFWGNALYWPLGETWGNRTAEYVGIRGDPDMLKDHQQNVRVIPYREPEVDEERLTEEEIATHITDGYAARTVPETADVVTCTVDVQSGYVYYLVRAWRRADGTSWLIDLGTVGKPLRNILDEADRRHRRAAGINMGLDTVDAKCRAGWPRVKPGGEVVGQIQLKRGLVDRGFEADIVAGWWLAKHRGVWSLIKGQKAGTKGALWPPRPKRDPRNRPYRYVDVNQAKHILRKLLRIGIGEPGYWHMPREGIHVNTLRAYYRHLASERFNRELRIPRWEKITEGLANHFLDDETYQISAALSCGVRLVGLEAVTSQERKPVTDWFAKQRKKTRMAAT